MEAICSMYYEMLGQCLNRFWREVRNALAGVFRLAAKLYSAPVTAAAERDDLSFVWEAVKSLPVKYREVIHLFYHEGCSVREISNILKRPEATVRSDLHRGRERLREILREEYDFDEAL